MRIIARRATPISVMSTCLSDLKVATWCHGSALAGIKANEKQAVAIAKPRMSTRELTSNELVDFGPAWLRKLRDAPSVPCGLNLTGGAVSGCRAAAFRWTLWARILAFFGWTLTGCNTTLGAAAGVEATGAALIGARGVFRAVLFGVGNFRGGRTLGDGSGAGTGAGSVGVDTVVGGGSSARPALEVERANAPPARSSARSGSADRHPQKGHFNTCNPSSPPLRDPRAAIVVGIGAA